MMQLKSKYEEEIQSVSATACCICGSSNIAELGIQAGGETITIMRRTVVECMDCEHKFCPEPIALERIRDWYIGNEYFEQNCNHQNITNIADDSQWAGFISHRVAIMDKFGISPKNGAGRKLIEIGCLEGRLIRQLYDNGWDAEGIEINSEVAKNGSRLLNIKINSLSIEEWDGGNDNFDCAISFHTFEHLRDPVASLRKVHRALKNEGICLIEVPCDDQEFTNPDHLHFFSIKSVERMMDIVFGNHATETNFYTTAMGVKMGSVYVAGRK